MTANRTRFGPYELAEPIGSGGMGEVYRATDTTLERDVAIKLLPASFVDDPDRVARFEREAKMLAALDHYNIAQIFGLERGETGTALVMELVAGPTLAERIAQGPLPLDEACDIARQICVALEAAHERGIVHRDLKPANVKLRPDGVVKVLDFGLAKVVEAPGAPPANQGAALTTPALTEVGQILGTAAYMSPEQARGKHLDQRADIWAFGAVLYEMLTGQPAFLGEDVTETVAAVLKTEPDWSALPPLPAQLEAMLRQCLVKDPKNRVHDIADVRLAIDGAYRWTASPAASAGNAVAGPASRVLRLGWPAAAVVGLLAGAAGMRFWGAEPAISTEPFVTNDPPALRPLTFRRGRIQGAQFTAEGDVVYAAAWDDEPYRIYTTSLDSSQSRPVSGLPPAALFSLSNEGILALAMNQTAGSGYEPLGVLARVDLSGGTPRELYESISGADWGPDGGLAVIVRVTDGVSVLEFPPGEPVHTSPVIVAPRVSPDGRRVCFAADWNEIRVATLDGSARALVQNLPRASSCAWSPGGDEVWFGYAPDGSTRASIDAIRPDSGSRRTLFSMTSFGALEDVAPNGDMLITAGDLRYSVHAASSRGARERDLTAFDASLIMFLSASGQEVVLRDNSVGAGGDPGKVFIASVDGDDFEEFGAWNAFALTPDGRELAILGTTDDWFAASNKISFVPTGAGASEVIDLPVTVEYRPGNSYGTNEWQIRFPEFSDNGRRLLLPYAREGDAEPRAYVHDRDEGWTRPVTPLGVTGAVVLSPDGQYVASNEDDGLFVYEVGGDGKRAVPGGRDRGVLARWSLDQDYVYVLEPYTTGARVYRRSLVSDSRELVNDIAAPDPAGVIRFDLWLARDGEAYAYTLQRATGTLYLLQNVR